MTGDVTLAWQAHQTPVPGNNGGVSGSYADIPGRHIKDDKKSKETAKINIHPLNIWQEKNGTREVNIQPHCGFK